MNRRTFLSGRIASALAAKIVPAPAFARPVDLAWAFSSPMSPPPRESSSSTTAEPTAANTCPKPWGRAAPFSITMRDGWQDILLVNGMDWPGHKRQRSTLRLYHNNRNGTFTDVTEARVWTWKCTAWAWPWAITTTTAFPTY